MVQAPPLPAMSSWWQRWHPAAQEGELARFQFESVVGIGSPQWQTHVDLTLQELVVWLRLQGMTRADVIIAFVNDDAMRMTYGIVTRG
jgi:hypothetical protein